MKQTEHVIRTIGLCLMVVGFLNVCFFSTIALAGYQVHSDDTQELDLKYFPAIITSMLMALWGCGLFTREKTFAEMLGKGQRHLKKLKQGVTKK